MKRFAHALIVALLIPALAWASMLGMAPSRMHVIASEPPPDPGDDLWQMTGALPNANWSSYFLQGGGPAWTTRSRITNGGPSGDAEQYNVAQIVGPTPNNYTDAWVCEPCVPVADVGPGETIVIKWRQRVPSGTVWNSDRRNEENELVWYWVQKLIQHRLGAGESNRTVLELLGNYDGNGVSPNGTTFKWALQVDGGDYYLLSGNYNVGTWYCHQLAITASSANDVADGRQRLNINGTWVLDTQATYGGIVLNNFGERYLVFSGYNNDGVTEAGITIQFNGISMDDDYDAAFASSCS